MLLTLLLLGAWLPLKAYSDTLACALEAASARLQVDVKVNLPVADSWQAVTYDELTDEQEVLRYLGLMVREFGKYPDGYLGRSHARTIILGNDLQYCGQPRAAIPDPYRNQLYLSVNGAFGIASDRYLVHVMHHELHHCTEFAIWKNMTFDWAEWHLLNQDGFCYGNGGSDAYDDALVRRVDYYSPVNPQLGFVNRYSLLGDEEDRAELVAFLMSDLERDVLKTLLAKDAVLKRKSMLLARLLNSAWGAKSPLLQHFPEWETDQP